MDVYRVNRCMSLGAEMTAMIPVSPVFTYNARHSDCRKELSKKPLLLHLCPITTLPTGSEIPHRDMIKIFYISLCRRVLVALVNFSVPINSHHI